MFGDGVEMRLLVLTFLAVAAPVISAQSSKNSTPNSAKILLQGGRGCPQSYKVEVLVGDSGKELRVKGPLLALSTEVSKVARIHCLIRVRLNPDNGRFRISQISTAYRADLALDASARFGVQFTAGKSEIAKHILQLPGPHSTPRKEWRVATKSPWSSCGAASQLGIKTSIVIKSKGSTNTKADTMEMLDSLKVFLEWQEC
jgi:hypothetical protein